MNGERFEGLDGIRIMAAIGIILKHVQANMDYTFPGGEKFFLFLNSFVGLFMIVSSFSMCCGYYDKIISGTYSIEDFYSRRWKKVWPFFAFVVCLDFIVSPSKGALYEAFANLTLVFCLLPNANINVIGVGWTLGVIFIFYIMFPFFCFLFKNRKRAWMALVVSILLRIACSNYFFGSDFVVDEFTRQSNFLYNSIYFVLGGLLYLYRDSIVRIFSMHKGITFSGVILLGFCSALLQQCGNDALTFGTGTLFFVLWIIYAISCPGGFLINSISRKLSSVSLEIYLSHMFVFRTIELIGLSGVIKNHPTVNYMFVVVMVVIGTIIFSIIANKMLTKLQMKICR